MNWRRKCGQAAILMLLAAGANAQSRVGSGPFELTGSFFTPAAFAEFFEVRLLRESEQPIAQMRVRTNERFLFQGLTSGTYFVVAEIPGFEKVRRRVTVDALQGKLPVNIFLELARRTIVRRPLNLSGEKDGVVSAADLKRYASHLTEGLAAATDDLRDGDLESARLQLESIVKEAPDLYAAHKTLGATYQRLHRFSDAEAEYQLAHNLRPTSAAPLISLGSLYLEKADADAAEGPTAIREIINRALGSLLQAVELNPDAPFAHYLLGVAYYKVGLFEDAEEHLLRAIELENRLGDARVALANVYIQIQEWPAALNQLQTYLDENPDASNVQQIRQVASRIALALEAEEEGGSRNYSLKENE